MNSITNFPLISVVIPNHNGSRFLESCLRSLQSQTYRKMEIIVVDNASRDDSIKIARSTAPGTILLQKDRNFGFAGAVNAGIQCSSGDWIAVLNNDTEVPPDWLAECARAIQEHPDAAFFACRILDIADRNRIYSAGDCYLRAGIGYRRGQERQDRPEFSRECRIFSASGCAALYRRKVLEQTGGFDERFFAYLEERRTRIEAPGCGFRWILPAASGGVSSWGRHQWRGVFQTCGAAAHQEFSVAAVKDRSREIPAALLADDYPRATVLDFAYHRSRTHGILSPRIGECIPACTHHDQRACQTAPCLEKFRGKLLAGNPELGITGAQRFHPRPSGIRFLVSSVVFPFVLVK